MDPIFDLTGARVWVAGHRGMVGSAFVRRLEREPVEIITVGREELDLRDSAAVKTWLANQRPDVVIMSAAKVGGISANDRLPVDFLSDNLAMALAVIDGSFAAGVRKLLMMGSSCVYPKLAPQPIKEEYLLTGLPEPTNQWYAIAKIAALKLCQAYRRQHGADFISAMPTNLYGLGDNYHPEDSHVPAGLIQRMDRAKRAGESQVTIWGTGQPLREFLFVDDLADACVHILRHYSDDPPINVGSGQEVSIGAFARLVAEAVDYKGAFHFDTSRPDGTPRKLLDSSRLAALGWRAQTPLKEGLRLAYADFQARQQAGLIAA